jgi:uncharacterized RDD family membrane protein YckC
MMKCAECGYDNLVEDTWEWDGQCDECGYLMVAAGEPLDPAIDGSIRPPVVSAPTGKRIINFIGDQIIFAVVLNVATLMFTSATNIRFVGESVGTIWGFNLLLLFLYYFLFETKFQQTPAKFVTRTEVVMADGAKPTDRAIALRTLIRIFVPFLAFSMSADGTWWHDRWTRTRVVERKKHRR